MPAPDLDRRERGPRLWHAAFNLAFSYQVGDRSETAASKSDYGFSLAGMIQGAWGLARTVEEPALNDMWTKPIRLAMDDSQPLAVMRFTEATCWKADAECTVVSVDSVWRIPYRGGMPSGLFGLIYDEDEDRYLITFSLWSGPDLEGPKARLQIVPNDPELPPYEIVENWGLNSGLWSVRGMRDPGLPCGFGLTGAMGTVAAIPAAKIHDHEEGDAVMQIDAQGISCTEEEILPGARSRIRGVIGFR